MAEIFALQGPGSCGKTETIIKLCAALQTKYPAATCTELHNGTIDIKVILRGIKGKTIGIESQGDPNSRLKQSLVDFKNVNCEIIFCACRTSGMTEDWINAMTPKYQVTFIPKNRLSNGHSQANAVMVKLMMQMASL